MFKPYLELSVLFDLKKKEQKQHQCFFPFKDALFQTDYTRVWHSHS